MKRRFLKCLALGFLLSAIGCGGTSERLPISDRSKSSDDQSQSKLIQSKSLTTTCNAEKGDEEDDAKSDKGSKEILDLNALVELLSSTNGDKLGRTYINNLQIFNAAEYEKGRYVDVNDQSLMRKLIELIGFDFFENRMENISKMIGFKVKENCKTIQSTVESNTNTYSIDLKTSNGRSLNFLAGNILRNSVRLVSDSAVEVIEEISLSTPDGCGLRHLVVLRISRIFEFLDGAPETISLRKEIYDALQVMTAHPTLITSAAELPDSQSRNPNTVNFDLGVLRLFDDSLSSARNDESNTFEIQKASCETDAND